MTNEIYDSEKTIVLPKSLTFIDGNNKYVVSNEEIKTESIHIDGQIVAVNLYADIEGHGTVGACISNFYNNHPLDPNPQPHLQGDSGVIEPDPKDDEYDEYGDYDGFSCDTEMSLSENTLSKISIEWNEDYDE